MTHQTARTVFVKTDEAIGPALNWATAIALGWVDVQITGYDDPDSTDEPFFRPGKVVNGIEFCQSGQRWQPSTDQKQGGLVIDLMKIDTEYSRAHDSWLGSAFSDRRILTMCRGKLRLEAAMRALVAMQLGDLIEVPAALVPRAA